jgi:hypothetical protein
MGPLGKFGEFVKILYMSWTSFLFVILALCTFGPFTISELGEAFGMGSKEAVHPVRNKLTKNNNHRLTLIFLM